MNLPLSAFAVALIAVSACANRAPLDATAAVPASRANDPPPTASDDACPMTVPGTVVTASDSADGADMTFKTAIGDVAILRGRVRAMADRMNGRPTLGGADAGAEMVLGPTPVHARAFEVDGGARLHITPVDPTKLHEIRQNSRHVSQTMEQQQDCPTMTTGASR